MSHAAEAVLTRLEELHVAVSVKGDSLRLRGEGPPLPPELVEEIRRAKPELLVRLRSAGSLGKEWPPESDDYVRRFGCSEARLYPFIGKRVATPDGPGVLLQVLRNACAVRLDREPARVTCFPWTALQGLQKGRQTGGT